MKKQAQQVLTTAPYYTPCAIKRETPYSWWYLCRTLTDFQNPFTGWFSSKFAEKNKLLLKVPPYLAYYYHATLWNIIARKQAINDKLQCNVATYFRCGGVVSNQIKKSLLLSLPVKCFFKSVNTWQSYKQEGTRLFRALCAPGYHTATSRHNPPFFRAMLCIGGTSHGPVSVCLSVRPSVRHKSELY